jgi:TonB family protein
MSKPKFLAKCIVATLFSLSLEASVLAQSNIAAKANGIPTKPASNTAESDRVKDGLAGPVRRIRTEIAKLASNAGKTSEEKHVVLEVASYDMKGTKTENQYFPVAGSTLTGKEVYKYDEKGNISEMTVLTDSGSLLSKEIYKYDYDSVGNWTRMTTSVAVIEGGKVTFEPTEVTYRSIMYYLDENMLKMAQPATGVAAAPASSTNSPSNVASSDVKTPAVVPSGPTAQPAAANAKLSGNSRGGNHPKPAPSLPAARVLGNTGINNFLPLKFVNTSETAKATMVPVESEPPPPPAKSLPKSISGGALNGRALSLPPPNYPEAAKRARLSGIVTIEVVVDETGKVVSAQATAGPALLRDAAIQAALKAKFSPTMLSGQPVKVTGTINYKFNLAQ